MSDTNSTQIHATGEATGFIHAPDEKGKPTGPGRGQRSARKARKVGEALGVKVATDGASPEVLHALGIPLDWAQRCEDAAHVGHDGTNATLALRLDWLRSNQFSNFVEKV